MLRKPVSPLAHSNSCCARGSQQQPVCPGASRDHTCGHLRCQHIMNIPLSPTLTHSGGSCSACPRHQPEFDPCCRPSLVRSNLCCTWHHVAGRMPDQLRGVHLTCAGTSCISTGLLPLRTLLVQSRGFHVESRMPIQLHGVYLTCRHIIISTGLLPLQTLLMTNYDPCYCAVVLPLVRSNSCCALASR